MTDTAVRELCGLDDREAVSRIFGFATVLREAGALAEDTDQYFERPWKWQPEYELWLQAGSPLPAEPGELHPTDFDGWPTFLAALEREGLL